MLWYYRVMPRRLTNEEFLQRVAKRPGYIALSEYKNNSTKVLFRHSCGEEFLMAPSKFFAGQGCYKCGRIHAKEKLSEKGQESFSRALVDLGLEIAEKDFHYTNNSQKVLVRCLVCGREQKSLINNITAGHGCQSCKNKLVGKEEKFKKTLAKKAPDWELVGTYERQTIATEFRHKKCGKVFSRIPYTILAKPNSCKRCHPSAPEKEIYDWVASIMGEDKLVANDRDHLKMLSERGRELDIYIPSKNVAIEYNGHFHHSAQGLTRINPETGKPRMTYAEAKKYHYLKSFWCERQGIRLIHIWDYEWADERKQKVLKNIILGALGMLPERYYARDCEVHRYDIGCPEWSRINQFFKENNIQGSRGGRFIYTLEKDGRVLMGYKFGRPSGGRAKKLYEYEMVRGAAAPGTQVIGGASRLWSHFIKDVKPNSIVYYVDYNYFDGKSVEKLGGKFITSGPGVKNYWVKTGEVKNREPSHHKEVKKAIENGEVLELWNAGTKTYAFYW